MYGEYIENWRLIRGEGVCGRGVSRLSKGGGVGGAFCVTLTNKKFYSIHGQSTSHKIIIKEPSSNDR